MKTSMTTPKSKLFGDPEAEYWANRAVIHPKMPSILGTPVKRSDFYVSEMEKTASVLRKSYVRAKNYVAEQSRKIFESYSKNFFEKGTDIETIKKYLRESLENSPDTKTLQIGVPKKFTFWGGHRQLQVANKLPESPQKQAMIAKINAPAYAYRIKKLEDLIKNVTEICRDIYDAELIRAETFFENLGENAYHRQLFELQVNQGLTLTFPAFQTRVRKRF
jgi:hypothetical protein